MSPIFDIRFHERGLHNFEGNLTQPRHRWYPFKEGFSSELVDEAITSITLGANKSIRILDPFCGSGTTPVSAGIQGHETVAIEVNPFCAFTARVKCSPRRWRDKPFIARLDQILIHAKRDRQPSHLEKFSTFCESKGKDKWLFNRSVLRAFHGVFRAVGDGRDDQSDALRLAAIRGAMECCNAKKDGKALRYKKDWRDTIYNGADFFDAFRRSGTQFLEDTKLAPIDHRTKISIRRADSRRVLQSLSPASFDLMVTSPPYLNSFDYSDVYRPELFLGGFVNCNDTLRKIRIQTLRSHIQVKWDGPTQVVTCPLLDEPLKELRSRDSLWDTRLPEMVEAYFYDMHKILMDAAKLLRPGAEAWIVVSTSAYAGVHIPVDLILSDLATRSGFSLKGVYVMRALRAAGQQQKHFSTDGFALRESLLVLTRER